MVSMGTDRDQFIYRDIEIDDNKVYFNKTTLTGVGNRMKFRKFTDGFFAFGIRNSETEIFSVLWATVFNVEKPSFITKFKNL